MGKKLIIKGANFYENRIDTTFEPAVWFVNALDSAAGSSNPIGYGLGPESSIQEPRQGTGMMSPNPSQGHLFYGPINNFNQYRYCTRAMVSLKTLYDNGYRSVKITPKANSTVCCAYSTTPNTSSTDLFGANTWNYNKNTTQKTIPLASNTYILFMAKASSSAQSSVTDYVDISFA
jgi:hypothetical protein